MVGSKRTSEMQFLYWDRARRGESQSSIASEFGITRQAVNKSIKLQERSVMIRMLDVAMDTGVLVESFDEKRGFLIGISPQLNRIPVLMIIDNRNRVRVFYDQSRNPDEASKRTVVSDLREVLRDSLGIDPGERSDLASIFLSLERWRDR